MNESAAKKMIWIGRRTLAPGWLLPPVPDLPPRFNHPEKEETSNTMNQPINLKSTMLAVRNWISPATAGRGFLFVALALALVGFALSPMARAQLPPPAPDGGYPNQNTAEGDHALFSLTTGCCNTANGYFALSANTTGGANTATGAFTLEFNTTGSNNTANGEAALGSNTTGGDNTATGIDALLSNTTGNNNTANGDSALELNTTGGGNTATGSDALVNNTTGNYNTATGFHALLNNTASDNTANGAAALQSNTTGGANTAIGYFALSANTTGNNNTANGFAALQSNTTGGQNTASGDFALQLNTTGGDNTAAGFNALASNTTGGNNIATGVGALELNTTGTQNTATGFAALVNNATGSNNTGEGFQALLHSTGSNNIALGANAGINLTSGSNNIDIGASGAPGESNTIRIGTVGVHKSAYMRGISGATVAGGVGVIVDTKGHLGTVSSSARFKEAIKPMDKASEAILALEPVTFRYKKQLDPEGISQFGLVAEQVEKVNPDLVARDGKGQVYTVRYEAVNAMLLNEFLKEHRKVQQLESKAQEQERKAQKQEAMIAQQQKGMEILNASLKEQAAQIQKVSDQLEVSRAAPQMVVNNQ
jgi:hypothetical protein